MERQDEFLAVRQQIAVQLDNVLDAKDLPKQIDYPKITNGDAHAGFVLRTLLDRWETEPKVWLNDKPWLTATYAEIGAWAGMGDRKTGDWLMALRKLRLIEAVKPPTKRPIHYRMTDKARRAAGRPDHAERG